MAEVQRSTQSGEMAARFIEFVMMQAQNASLFLGLIPNPSTGKPEVNLDLARMFIDQLSMIQEKTRGNLSNEETAVLRNYLTQLQMAFVEASQGGAAPAGQVEELAVPAEPVPVAAASGDETTFPSTPQENPAAADEQRESKKRFTKSYGG